MTQPWEVRFEKLDRVLLFHLMKLNDNLRTVVIAPMTSTSRNYPTRVKVKHNSQEAWVVMDQLITIGKIRMVEKYGSLSEKEIRECKRVIQETFVD